LAGGSKILIKKHELVPQVEWAQRAEWFTRDTLELLDRWEVDEIDQLLRLKQMVDVDRI
jgi:hypothetical protein